MVKGQSCQVRDAIPFYFLYRNVKDRNTADGMPWNLIRWVVKL